MNHIMHHHQKNSQVKKILKTYQNDRLVALVVSIVDGLKYTTNPILVQREARQVFSARKSTHQLVNDPREWIEWV